jgi:DNA-binding NarL/FixJ family response regulator
MLLDVDFNSQKIPTRSMQNARKMAPIKALPLKIIDIVIAEDNAAMRQALTVLLAAVVNFRLVGAAKSGKKAVHMATRLQPHIMIMDIHMPLLNGLRATRQITELSSKTKVIILSAHSDPEYINEAVECGARGFLSKYFMAEALVRAIQEVQNGKTYFACVGSPDRQSKRRDPPAPKPLSKPKVARIVKLRH